MPVTNLHLSIFLLTATGLIFAAAGPTSAQTPARRTAEQNRRHMMDQLQIQSLRPGPSGDENAPNHANYDPARANPFPDLPDALTTHDGEKVTTPKMWWDQRRPEILADYAREVYGRVPENTPQVRWEVTVTDHERIGWPPMPVTAREVIGHVDNSAVPGIDVDIRMIVVTPDRAPGPAPLLVMFGRPDFPAPSQPSHEEYKRIDAALKAAAAEQDPRLKSVFEAHPAFTLHTRPPFHFPDRNADGDPPSPEQLIAAGWGYAVLDPSSIQADNGAGLTRGIIGLVNKGKQRKPDDWGALRAWQWGASRALDFLAQDPAIDGEHVGIEGVSRYGKAALVTMAFDRRFAMVLVGSSGKGGATLLRRNFGEAVANLATGEFYWFAGNFLKYNADQSARGPMDASDLPVDAHELIALCAPRLTFISYGVPAQGDAKWLDHRGSFMAAVAASPVFELLGAKGLGVDEDFHDAEMPPVNHGLLDGRLAWRQHDGGHTDAPNMKYFIRWVDKFIGHTPPKR